jgi:hypothetical protein
MSASLNSRLYHEVAVASINSGNIYIQRRECGNARHILSKSGTGFTDGLIFY